MATIDDFGGEGQSLKTPPLGGPNGWAAAVRDKLRTLEALLPHVDIPGSIEGVPGGRLLRTTGGGTAWDVQIDTSVPVVPSPRWMRDTVTVAAAGDVSLSLGDDALPFSTLVTRGGLVLAEGVDYTAAGRSVDVTDCEAGDVVQVTYAFDADTAVSVPPAAATLNAWSVIDDFERADSASSLGSAPTGQVWTAVGGVWGIVSGRAVKMDLDKVRTFAVVDAGVGDVELDAVFETGVDDVGSPQVVVRANAGCTDYLLVTRERVYRVSASKLSQLSVLAVPVDDGDRVRVRCVGTQVWVHVRSGDAGPWRLSCGPLHEPQGTGNTRHGLAQYSLYTTAGITEVRMRPAL